MTSCCRGIERDYESLTDDFSAPSKSSICCGRTYQWLKENGAVSQIAFLALAMVAAGLTAYIEYSPHIEPSESTNIAYIASLGAFIGICALASIGHTFSFPHVRRIPNPCTLTFGCVVVAAVVLKVQRGVSEDMILSYQENHTTITNAENVLFSECRAAIVANPETFTDNACHVCDYGMMTTGSTWFNYPFREICQLYQVPVDADLCFYRTVSYDSVVWEYLQNVYANVSEIPEAYPCGDIYRQFGNDTFAESLDPFEFLAEMGWHPPMILNVTVVNQSNGDLIGCKRLKGFANLKFPITSLCNLTRKKSPSYPLEMPCQTTSAAAYFNLLDSKFKNITANAIKNPARAYKLMQSDPTLAWVIALLVSGTGAAINGGVSHCRAEKHRKESRLLLIG